MPFEILTGTVPDKNRKAALLLISIDTTTVYNESFTPITTIPPNMIIGFPLLTLDTGKGIFIKVRTIQNSKRWVKAQDVTLRNRL